MRSSTTAELVLVLSALLACKGSGGDKSAPTPPSAEPVATPSAAPAVPARPKLADGAVGSAWTTDQQRWVQAFKYRWPDAAPVGASFADARKACAAASLDLCTEEQWALVCAQDAGVGRVPSWTLSPASTPAGWVVMGGNGCSLRAVTVDGAAAPERIGLCCEPRASLSTQVSRQEAVMKAAQTYLTLIEGAANSHSAARIAALLADSSQLYGTTRTRDEAQKALDWDLGRYSELGTRMVACDVDAGGPNGFMECETVATRTAIKDPKPELSVFRQRFEFVQYKYTVFGKPVTVRRKWGAY
jgi:hypothetical protein